jgi:hypothetical protein
MPLRKRFLFLEAKHLGLARVRSVGHSLRAGTTLRTLPDEALSARVARRRSQTASRRSWGFARNAGSNPRLRRVAHSRSGRHPLCPRNRLGSPRSPRVARQRRRQRQSKPSSWKTFRRRRRPRELRKERTSPPLRRTGSSSSSISARLRLSNHRRRVAPIRNPARAPTRAPSPDQYRRARPEPAARLAPRLDAARGPGCSLHAFSRSSGAERPRS